MATRKKNSPDVLLAQTTSWRFLTGSDAKGVPRVYVEPATEVDGLAMVDGRVFDAEANEEFVWTLAHGMRRMLGVDHPLSELLRESMRGYSVLHPEAREWPTEADASFPAELVPYAAALVMEYAAPALIGAHLYAAGVLALSQMAGDVPGLNPPETDALMMPHLPPPRRGRAPGLLAPKTEPDDTDDDVNDEATEWDDSRTHELPGGWVAEYRVGEHRNVTGFVMRRENESMDSLAIPESLTSLELGLLYDSLIWRSSKLTYLMPITAMTLRARLIDQLGEDYRVRRQEWTINDDETMATFRGYFMAPVSLLLALTSVIGWRYVGDYLENCDIIHQAALELATVYRHDELKAYGV